MRTTTVAGGVSRFSNLNKFARTLITDVPFVPGLNRPALYMQVDLKRDGCRILVETVDPAQASELVMSDQDPEVAKSSEEYLIARFADCGIEVLKSRDKLGVPKAVAA